VPIASAPAGLASDVGPTPPTHAGPTASADPPQVPASIATAHPRPRTGPPKATAEPPTASAMATSAACKPNYTLDAEGNKHFKPECFPQR
jgi:hypothetical protein